MVYVAMKNVYVFINDCSSSFLKGFHLSSVEKHHWLFDSSSGAISSGCSLETAVQHHVYLFFVIN